ncbi:hypothetical protein Tco_1075831 [Tanacetum coccineum]
MDSMAEDFMQTPTFVFGTLTLGTGATPNNNDHMSMDSMANMAEHSMQTPTLVPAFGQTPCGFTSCLTYGPMHLVFDELMDVEALNVTRIHYNICHIPQRQIRGIPGDLSLGICFPGDLSPGIGRAKKLEGDTFPGDLPGRHRGAPHSFSQTNICHGGRFSRATCRLRY